ncbi:hypothetical protein HDV03_000973 [Kappamyces sp. JEL0829]|nr:hypothetical protein HDV03_000973 [Kappamyces sp. JEL0829]KAJ3362393.1 hypothetical protein HDU91_003450 [Kappamyces sp. JEL0680]
MPNEKIAVGILGATGTVGQRFIELLADHPNFYVAALGASERSAGKEYKEACNWKMTTRIPKAIAGLKGNELCLTAVTACDPIHFKQCRVIFSGLDASVAGDVELAFLAAEFAVFSNAKNHRMNPQVPLIVPLVNSSHFDIIPNQQKAFKKSKGFLITNANCSTTGLVTALKPLQDAFGPLAKVVVTTMQAISGAGYPGVPSLDILGNIVPFISGEEPKLEEETCKILGGVDDSKSSIQHLTATKVSASCNRVAVIEGHTESVYLEFTNRPAPSLEAIANALSSYTCEAQTLGCYSAPTQPVVVLDEKDRPQPRLDAFLEGGNAVVVGGIRPCGVFDVKFTLLVHNTILGAAGSSIMNAELALAKGLI